MRLPIRLLILVLLTGYLVSAPPPLAAATTDTFRDEFNNQLYSNNDGTASWAGDWTESESPQDPIAGTISVQSDGAEDFALLFADAAVGDYVERTADLSAFDAATLTYDYRQHFMTPAVGFEVQVSEDGSSWDTVWSMWGSGSDASYLPVSVDLSGYSATSTIVRFIHTAGTPAGFIFHLDNVQIAEAAPPANNDPVAVADNGSTTPNTPVTIDVLANDTDADLDPLSISAVTQGSAGTVVNSVSDLTYTPGPAWLGTDTFTYTVTDGNGGFDIATVTVDVSAVNDDPIVVDDPDVAVDPAYYLIRRDSSRSLNVLINDTDPEGDPLTVISAGPGINGGTATVAGDGLSVTYTSPAASYVGPDTFTYTISDGNGGTASGFVDVWVVDKLADIWAESIVAVPADPSQGSPFDLVVVSKNLGPDSALNTQVTIQLPPALAHISGTASNGTCAETPPGSGTIVCSHGNPPGDSSPRMATLSVVASSAGPHTVTAVIASDDLDPVPANNLAELTFGTPNTAPAATDDSDTTPEDVGLTIDVLANDADADLDAMSVDSVTAGLNGSVTNNGTNVTYTPDPDWNGIDTFSYTASDGNGGFASAQVTVTVTPVNDDPAAVDDLTTVGEDSSETIPVLGNDSDLDGDLLTITGVIDGSNGSVVNNGTNVTYIPNPDWSGIDTFMYSISDGNGGTASAFVTVTVDPVNDDPQGMPDFATTPEDNPITLVVLANDTDVDSSALTVTAVADGSNGTVTTDGITVTYTPYPDWFGTDTFTYRVSDDLGGWGETTVTVTVTPVNDNPVAVDDISTTPRDTPVYVWVLDNDTDVDPDTLSVSAFTNGTNGSVVNNSIKVTYTPAPGWTGTDSFTYTVSDGNGGFDTATVTVTVTAGPNRPPVAQDDGTTIDEDTSATLAVLANDSDPDGDTVTVSATNQGAHGTVTNTATSVTYTPDKDWAGIDSFSYSITDGRGGTATAAIVITVKPVNDAPIARDDAATTTAGSAIAVAVLANDTDVEGQPLTVVSAGPGSNGVTATDGVSVTYVPAPGWFGTDLFSYTISDGHGGIASGTVKVTVDAVTKPPIVAEPPGAAGAVGEANHDPAITVTGMTVVAEGTSLRLVVRTEDPDGDEVTISVTGLPDWAKLVDDGRGGATIIGIPGIGAPAASRLTVDASDGKATSTVTVTIEVLGGNRPPRIGTIRFSGVDDDGSFSFTITASDPDGDPLAIAADGLPGWASLTDNGGGSAIIGSNGIPVDALGWLSVVISVTDGRATVTTDLVRPIADLRPNRPPESTHQAFGMEGAGSLVATAMMPRVGSPDLPTAHLTPREGLMVAFGSAVETIKNQILPALVLGVVMAWMLMIGVGRTKEEDQPEAA